MDTPGWSVTALLCDHAQVADGKLFISGGGWTFTGPGPFTHAIAFKLNIPWSEANERHTLAAHLTDEDGHSVTLGEPPNEVRFGTQFEVGRPVGLPAGAPLSMPLAVNLGPMELEPGAGYAWVVSIDDQEFVRIPFRIRLPPMPGQPG
jgi:hypothetical protein